MSLCPITFRITIIILQIKNRTFITASVGNLSGVIFLFVLNRRIFQRIDAKFRRYAFQSTQKSFLNPRVFIQSSRFSLQSARFSLQSARFPLQSARFFFNPHVLLTIEITVTLSVTFSVTPIICI